MADYTATSVDLASRGAVAGAERQPTVQSLEDLQSATASMRSRDGCDEDGGTANVDKDPAVRQLARRMERANSSEHMSRAMRDLRREARGARNALRPGSRARRGVRAPCLVSAPET
jgi:hypothetical protein